MEEYDKYLEEKNQKIKSGEGFHSKAARQIQRVFRGYLARLEARRRRKAVWVIQKYMRSWIKQMNAAGPVQEQIKTNRPPGYTWAEGARPDAQGRGNALRKNGAVKRKPAARPRKLLKGLLNL